MQRTLGLACASRVVSHHVDGNPPCHGPPHRPLHPPCQYSPSSTTPLRSGAAAASVVKAEAVTGVSYSPVSLACSPASLGPSAIPRPHTPFAAQSVHPLLPGQHPGGKLLCIGHVRRRGRWIDPDWFLRGSACPSACPQWSKMFITVAGRKHFPCLFLL